jgi:hypothetical protein
MSLLLTTAALRSPKRHSPRRGDRRCAATGTASAPCPKDGFTGALSLVSLIASVAAGGHRNVGERRPGAPAPYIASHSPHFAYAVHVLAGYSHQEACDALGITDAAARKFRERLRRTAAAYFGRVVSYEFSARFATDAALRREYEAHQALR